MQPNTIVDSNTVLTYSLVTKPMPVQVSPSGTTASNATLTFVVSCPKPDPTKTPRPPGTANVSQIEIVLPVDESGKPPDPTNLAETAPLASSASISSTGSDQWDISPGHAGVFLFTPRSGRVQVGAQSLTIEFTGIQVNTLVGTAVVRVNEWAVLGTGTPPPPSARPSGTAGIAVAKFPYGFYAGNFTADKPMVNDHETVTLSWVGSMNAAYKMFYGTTIQDVSSLRTWVSPPLVVNTTFILRVSAQVDGQTATIDFSQTIQVLNPSITATDLTVLTTSTLEGAVTVGAPSAPANLALNGDLNSTGNLNPHGNVTAGGNVSAGGNLSASGTANVTGTVTAGGLDSGFVTVAAAGNATALSGSNASGSSPTVYAANSVSNQDLVTGIQVVVATTRDVAFSTNGVIIGQVLSAQSVYATQFSVVLGGSYPAANLTIQSTSNPIILATNTLSNPSNVTGIVCRVAAQADTGFWTNGQVVGNGQSAMLTQLPTRSGHRVVTSPLSPEAEVHLSGSARLSKGKASVRFDADVSDLIHQSTKHAYRVLLTPTGKCDVLSVTKKSVNGFDVQERGDDKSNATFDWFIIARKPAALRAKTPHQLPKKLPSAGAPPDLKSKAKPAARKKRKR